MTTVRRASPSPLSSRVAPIALLAVAILGVMRLQPQLAAVAHETKLREDVYVLPPPQELRAMTLGYHAAAVDLLWAKLLVEYGIHHAERRPFPHLERYLDAILAIEPSYAALYRYVDTMLVYRPGGGTWEDAAKARAYLERGARERPEDAQVWMQLGQFLAFIAPSFLPKDANAPAVTETLRKDGADAMARAVELGATADRAMSAASILGRSGEREAAVRHLQRAYALTDDPASREQIAARLQALEASAQRDQAEQAVRAIETRWRSELPFVSRTLFLLLGPTRDAARCAGPASVDDAACPRDWADVTRR